MQEIKTPIQYISGHKILPTHMTCQELGMEKTVPNSPYNKRIATNNAEKLIQGILAYGTIIVDGCYQLDMQANYINYNSSKLMQKKIELIGTGPQAMLEFPYGTSQTNFINFGYLSSKELTNITLKNIAFKYDTENGRNSVNVNAASVDELTIERFVSLDKLYEAQQSSEDVGYWYTTVKNLLGPNAKMLVEEYTEEFKEGFRLAYLKYRNTEKDISQWDTNNILSELWYLYKTEKDLVCHIFLQAYNLVKNRFYTEPCRLTMFYHVHSPGSTTPKGCNEPLTISNVTIEHCKFFGAIRIFDFQRKMVSSAITIKSINIHNNEFHESRNSVFNCSNLAYDNIHVNNNQILNFDNAFLAFGVGEISENGQTLTGPQLAELGKNILIENNQFLCDDNWYHNLYSTATYYATCVIENIKVIYRNNRTVGMKAFRPVRLKLSSHNDKLVRVGFGLYQAYLSSKDVLFEDNYWENNLEFFNYENNTLLKAKDNQLAMSEASGGVSDENLELRERPIADNCVGIRRYWGNTFISTEEFIMEHLNRYWNKPTFNLIDYCNWMGYKYDTSIVDTTQLKKQIVKDIIMPQCKVSLMSNVSINDWEIKNNRFHICNMRGSSGTGASDKNVLTMSSTFYNYPDFYAYRSTKIPASDSTDEDSNISNESDVTEGQVWTIDIFNSSTGVKLIDYSDFYYYTSTDSALPTTLGWSPTTTPPKAFITNKQQGSLATKNGEVTADIGDYIYVYKLNDNDQFEPLSNITIAIQPKNSTYLRRGYYIRKLTVDNNIFDIDTMTSGLFGGQRSDATVKITNNTFTIKNKKSDAAMLSKPRLYTGKMNRLTPSVKASWDFSYEPIGEMIVKNNYFSGFGPLFVSLNAQNFEFSNNHITDTDYIVYWPQGDLSAINLKQLSYKDDPNPRVLPIVNFYGKNNTFDGVIPTYIGQNCLFELSYLIPSEYEGLPLVSRASIKENDIITYLPECGIACTGTTMVRIDGDVVPSYFSGSKIFSSESFNVHADYVNNILKADIGNIVLKKCDTDPSNPDNKQQLNCTIFSYHAN